jgi:DNA polymerase III epsilon subunit-like protein
MNITSVLQDFVNILLDKASVTANLEMATVLASIDVTFVSTEKHRYFSGILSVRYSGSPDMFTFRELRSSSCVRRQLYAVL